MRVTVKQYVDMQAQLNTGGMSSSMIALYLERLPVEPLSLPFRVLSTKLPLERFVMMQDQLISIYLTREFQEASWRELAETMQRRSVRCGGLAAAEAELSREAWVPSIWRERQIPVLRMFGWEPIAGKSLTLDADDVKMGANSNDIITDPHVILRNLMIEYLIDPLLQKKLRIPPTTHRWTSSLHVPPGIPMRKLETPDPRENADDAPRVWVVVGGSSRGGVTVYESEEEDSVVMGCRLAEGAIIEEIEIDGGRLHFERLTGIGPDVGWVDMFFRDGPQVAPLWFDSEDWSEEAKTRKSAIPMLGDRQRQRSIEDQRGSSPMRLTSIGWAVPKERERPESVTRLLHQRQRSISRSASPKRRRDDRRSSSRTRDRGPPLVTLYTEEIAEQSDDDDDDDDKAEATAVQKEAAKAIMNQLNDLRRLTRSVSESPPSTRDTSTSVRQPETGVWAFALSQQRRTRSASPTPVVLKPRPEPVKELVKRVIDYEVVSAEEVSFKVVKPRVVQRDWPEKDSKMIFISWRGTILKGVVVKKDGHKWLKSPAGAPGTRFWGQDGFTPIRKNLEKVSD
eukprot:gnl/TRDRNA2_/TRDRNA2_186720_c0_seq1.p1 gnl/TRDRNA2_/TRDRNA2_186720_c0~~gnl/TRDRNA2_/TRDRNA2_186720_c0_seq1.p1  ORF type:complete len:567 (-),score=96.26 gnl/TRDRNA2_/TRDRNA2_186720_c0_seq1:74-1774(-)